jgi:polyhydroxyalkanoate synthesis regulator phasin
MAESGLGVFTNSMRLQLRDMIRTSKNLRRMLEALEESRLNAIEQGAVHELLYANQFKELIDTRKEKDTLKKEVEELRNKVAHLEKRRLDDMLVWLNPNRVA